MYSASRFISFNELNRIKVKQTFVETENLKTGNVNRNSKQWISKPF